MNQKPIMSRLVNKQEITTPVMSRKTSIRQKRDSPSKSPDRRARRDDSNGSNDPYQQ